MNAEVFISLNQDKNLLYFNITPDTSHKHSWEPAMKAVSAAQAENGCVILKSVYTDDVNADKYVIRTAAKAGGFSDADVEGIST